MEQTLKVKITGDVQGLDEAALQAQKTMETLNSKIKQTSKDIAANIQISQGYERAIAELNKELSTGVISQAQYQKALTRLQRDEKETTLETSRLRKELSNLEKSQKELSRATPTLTNGINATGKATANATPTLIEFGRVIQDAPYGIQGVANNIQQLVTNFGYLKASAGSSQSAFKALIGSLTGPAGMVVAVSAVTSILVQYGDEIFKAIGTTDELKEATKEFIGEAKAEELALRSLVNIAQDDTKSKGVRVEAVKKLNEKYKDYLGNLTLEKINSEEAKTAVDELSKSIIRQAQIRGIEKLIEEKSLELAEAEIEAKEKGIKTANKVIASNKATTQSYEEQREAFNTFGKDYAKVQDSIRKKGAERIISGTIQSETEEIKTEVNTLLAFLESKLSEQLNFESIFKKGGTGNIEPPKIQVRGELTSLEVPLKPEGIQELSTAIQDVKIVMPPVDNSEYLRSLLEAQEMAGIFSEATSASLGAFASSVASAFETGNSVIDAFVGSLVKSFTEIIQAEANALIQKQALAGAGIAVDQAKSTSSAIAAGSQTAAASGPAAAFLLPALIAGAIAVVAAAFGSVGKFAQGGIVGGGKTVGDQIPIFVNSGEMVLTSRQQSNLFDLLNSSISNRSGIESGIIAEQRIRNGDIYLSYKRAERKNKRF